MKRYISLLTAVGLMQMASAQTLNVVVGETTYAFPADVAGDMLYGQASTLTIANREYALTDIDSIYVDQSVVTPCSVNVRYDGAKASVCVSGDVAQYLTVTAQGAEVSIVQSDALAQEVTYTLCGTSTDGTFFMDGNYKATVALAGLQLTHADGAAIDIENGKRINVVLTEGTSNVLADGATGSQKACFMVNGHTEFSGAGSLTLYGNAKHAFWGDEYVQLKKTMGSITVMKAQKDGFNVNQYFQQNGGSLTISGVGDDGIQVSADDEFSGYVLLKGGTQNISITGDASKALNAEGSITVQDGTYTMNTSGNGVYDADSKDTKACACISSDAHIVIDGGTLQLKSTGSGGKGMKSDSTLTINDGVINVMTTGAKYSYGSSGSMGGWFPGGSSSSGTTSYAKGIKAMGNIDINGGHITVSSMGSGSEGIESKSVLTVNGGVIEVESDDDCINSASHMHIKGGSVYVTAANNDGLDANGNLYIEGGSVVAYGASSPECGLDANEEQGYKVYFTGGTVVAIGGGNSVPGNASSTQAYVKYSGTVAQGQTIVLSNGSNALLAFSMGRSYGSAMGAGGRPGGGGGFPGGGGQNILISTPALVKGTSYQLYGGATVSGENWHGLYMTPSVTSQGSSLGSLTAIYY